MSNSIFISYRREDSAAEAGRVHSTLLRELGEDRVFMDTSSIEPGARWPRKLEDALRFAHTVLVIIGPDWLKISDEWGMRLIDKDGDWVRGELENAIDEGKEILPILVRGAKLPPTDKLPGTISFLTGRQAVEIRESYWEHDIQLVTKQLREGFDLTSDPADKSSDDPYPKNVPPERPDPVGKAILDAALNGSLSNWEVVVSPLPQDSSKIREELVRVYKFKRFLDAIAFMSQVAPGCDIAMHHPRWENLWRTITVHLSTWDIGNKISDRDLQLAKYFDRAFSEFPGASPEK